MTAVALRLLEDYSPARPVRLLGVRVAGLSSAGALVSEPDGPSDAESVRSAPSAADQLALPVSGLAEEPAASM